jgi:hypothetical protein
MLAIAIIAAAAGLVLGLRFSLVTLALLIITTTILFAVGIWGGGSPLVVALQLLGTLASVQISACLLHIFLRERKSPPAASKYDMCVMVYARSDTLTSG